MGATGREQRLCAVWDDAGAKRRTGFLMERTWFARGESEEAQSCGDRGIRITLREEVGWSMSPSGRW